MMKKDKLIAIVLTLVALVSCGEKLPTVAITQIVEHPALDAVRQGVADQLKKDGYEDGKNIRWLYESAQGNPVTAAQIAQKFAGEEPKVVIAIATPSAQAVVNEFQSSPSLSKIPVVFSAVTDPIAAKLVASHTKPGKNVTGVSDLSPMQKHMELVKEIVPDARTIGILYNSGEVNSVSLVRLAKEYAADLAMRVREATVSKSSEVLGAARSLAGNVDVIYVPTDNTVVSAIEAVVKVSEQSQTPLIAGDTATVERGAIAAIGFNYYDVGVQTGKMVTKILAGNAPGEIDVEGVETVELYLNPSAAERMGVKLPQPLIDGATKIVE